MVAPKHRTIATLDVAEVEAAVAADKGALRRRDRKKGSAREARSIRRVRTAFATLLEQNASQYQELFTKAAEKDPMKALALMVSLAEYYMPKLGRIEQTGTVEHKVSHFVPVTEREQPPALVSGGTSPLRSSANAREAIPGEFTSLSEVKP